ncbi:nitroreductase family protein [Mycolicibacterium obuense]|uniref:Putative NAD(P)H nitroreductase n=1 Tax=Mycolicibacterium obuense TaxID=1807 RepID=A0A0J6VEX9_9MYCO|nr:nitroreductase family protein [Mycolicibacterium obuense]KMO69565.1 putative NAD(P)H nitroreductase [Mycolicibacterium obuense]
MASGPDTATLERVLEAAGWAPSAKNAQPWSWHVDPNGLHLDADWSRRLGDSPFDRCDVLLACGAVLDHCAIALDAAGWATRIHRFPGGTVLDPGLDPRLDPVRLATFETIESAPMPAARELADVIHHRRSDRRHYASAALPETTVETLLVRAARRGVELGVVPAARWHRDDTGQVHLHYGDHAETSAAPADGVLLALGTEDDSDAARLRAGEAASRVLLSATAMGLASCPLTEPLRPARDRVALACEVFDGQRRAQMLIRIGTQPADVPGVSAVVRRSVAETTTWAVDGGQRRIR